MIRKILGVVAGYVVWTILWLGTDQLLIMLFPKWYGVQQMGLEAAYYGDAAFASDSSVLAVHIIRSSLFSVMSGFLAAALARENRVTPFALGVLLLLTGIMVEAAVWGLLPLWYHILFLLLILPMTMLGGRLRSTVATS